jgi:hypothetical protein
VISSPDKLENLGALSYEAEVRLKENIQKLDHVQENSAYWPVLVIGLLDIKANQPNVVFAEGQLGRKYLKLRIAPNREITSSFNEGRLLCAVGEN